MNVYLMMCAGVLLNVLAQLIIKKGAAYDTLSCEWNGYMGSSIFLYGLSFLVYSYVLKKMALNVAAPVMSVATLVCVVLLSFLFFKEELSIRQISGLFLGAIAVLLLLY